MVGLSFGPGNVALEMARQLLPRVEDGHRAFYLGLVEYVSEKNWKIATEVAKQLPKIVGKVERAALLQYVDAVMDVSWKSWEVGVEAAKRLPEMLGRFEDATIGQYLDIIKDMSEEISIQEQEVRRRRSEELEPLKKRVEELERLLSEQRRAGEEREKKAAEVAKQLSEVLGEIEGEYEEEYLDIVENVVEKDYAIAVEAVKQLPYLAREMSPSGVREWVDYGLEILEHNKSTARTYFRLESKTSIEVLAKLRSGVALKDVARVLKLYALALSGKEVAIKSTRDLPEEVRMSNGDAPCCDGKAIYLPPEVKEFSGDEDNFKVYKLSTTHKAAHLEFGTYDFDMEEIPEVIQKIGERYGVRM